MPPLSLYELGGWALFAFLALSIIVALIRGDLVPGPVHRAVTASADRLAIEGLRLARHARKVERERDRARFELRAEKAKHRRVGP